MPRALHVKDDVGSRIASDNVPREQHHQAIGPDDFALFVHRCDAIAVAVEGQPEVSALGVHDR